MKMKVISVLLMLLGNLPRFSQKAILYIGIEAENGWVGGVNGPTLIYSVFNRIKREKVGRTRSPPFTQPKRLLKPENRSKIMYY